ncbi:PTS sugar transporter subunit IIC [Entomospira culicis]|uniref:Permease IIC component n=1 Tax=Entomospira culicis TaxID=2719989 RepID=A0A968KWA1_9SPIO|nr:PTS sugar transporter subunit IIC [Entomospira culicis]NIZ19814.1 PTS sugar transporter subunit IIC [Entomospira culicis]NIZ70028.1 PTS sugar transporter subunit IIC [Entomospira culicis]WDI37134.1 PTS sugar transporter subunit IIC [Entomospira culicis]WDI38763.1 PTS sugar transporter subunit IIC [Entomospira culicis]
MSTGSLMEHYFLNPMTKLAKQRHLMAIRDGMVSTIPLTIVGSLFLIFLNLPFTDAFKEGKAFFQFLAANSLGIALPFRVTTGLIAIYATYNMGYSLAKSYELDGRSGGTLSLMAYFMTTMPQIADGLGFVIPLGRLGGASLFTGIFTSILSVEIFRLFVKKNLVIKMPEGVPDSVSKSFSALFPAFAIMIVMFTLITIAKVDLQAMFIKIFDPLKNIVDTPYGAVIIVFLVTLLWTMGIHGVSIVGAVARPIWTEMISENSSAYEAGAAIPYLTPEPFFQWFVWIGGSGGTLSLVFLLLFARSRYLKDLGKVTLIPALFNINEPVIFGLPIMLNPFFFVPFILGPVIVTIVSYIAIASGMVNIPVLVAPWTFPAPLGAFFATGLDIRAAILALVNIVILGVVYLPFMKMYDKKMYQEELDAAKE